MVREIPQRLQGVELGDPVMGAVELPQQRDAMGRAMHPVGGKLDQEKREHGFERKGKRGGPKHREVGPGEQGLHLEVGDAEDECGERGDPEEVDRIPPQRLQAPGALREKPGIPLRPRGIELLHQPDDGDAERKDERHHRAPKQRPADAENQQRDEENAKDREARKPARSRSRTERRLELRMVLELHCRSQSLPESQIAASRRRKRRMRSVSSPGKTALSPSRTVFDHTSSRVSHAPAPPRG